MRSSMGRSGMSSLIPERISRGRKLRLCEAAWLVRLSGAVRRRVAFAFARRSELADRIYDFTAGFPRDERFGLTAQMRRAPVSIGSNIFEGCSRQSNKSLTPKRL